MSKSIMLADNDSDDCLLFEVALREVNTGVHLTAARDGMELMEFSDRIFEVFQRLNGKDAFEGTGIGLAICKKIAENHQGFISAKGVPGQGATFTLSIAEKW